MTKRFFALILSLLMLLFVLASCKANEKDKADSNNVLNESIEVDLSKYSIIYSKENSSVTKKQASELQSIIKETASVELELKNDNEGEEDKEILVGMTVREQSADIYKKINGRGYAIVADNIGIRSVAFRPIPERELWFERAWNKYNERTSRRKV